PGGQGGLPHAGSSGHPPGLLIPPRAGAAAQQSVLQSIFYTNLYRPCSRHGRFFAPFRPGRDLWRRDLSVEISARGVDNRASGSYDGSMKAIQKNVICPYFVLL